MGLILVPEPYYNEPGYEVDRGTVEGRRRAAQYSEGVRVMTLQAIPRVVQRPPKGFETLTRDHFTACSELILRQCRADLEVGHVMAALGGLGAGAGASTGVVAAGSGTGSDGGASEAVGAEGASETVLSRAAAAEGGTAEEEKVGGVDGASGASGGGGGGGGVASAENAEASPAYQVALRRILPRLEGVLGKLGV